MTERFITSVRVEKGGSHERVAIFIRHQFVGGVVCGTGDGERLRDLLLGDDAERPTLPPEPPAPPADPTWLVKDFHVLYRAAENALGQATCDGYTTAHLRDLAAQLDRLAPAFEACERIREGGP
jgi:hypothetical protein